MPKKFNPNIPILWGDNQHDDSRALRHLFKGGAVYDMRSAQMIAAPGITHLPAGVYRTVPISREAFRSQA
jgi:hypothetical protein